jgi:hypothetical protein
MTEQAEILGYWLKARLLRKHPEGWALECEHVLSLVGKCMGSKTAVELAEFLGCQESDILRIMATISLCKEGEES